MAAPHLKALATSTLWRCPHLTPRTIKRSQVAVFVEAVNSFNGGSNSLNQLLKPKLLRFLHERGQHPGLPLLTSSRSTDASPLSPSDVNVRLLETEIVLDENQSEEEMIQERLRMLVKDTSQIQEWFSHGEELSKSGQRKSTSSALNIRVKCQFAFGVELDSWSRSFSSPIAPVDSSYSASHDIIEHGQRKYEWTCTSAQPVFKCECESKLVPQTDLSTSVSTAISQVWQTQDDQIGWIVEDMQQSIY